MINWLDPIIKGQLDTIQKEGLRSNEQELNLPENTQIYAGLYENGISREELARRIIDQWNISDGKDYFSDSNKEQIKKANSFANFIINDQATQEQIKLNQHTQDMDKRRSEIEAKQTMKMDDLKDLLEDKSEKTEENAEIIIAKAKTRVMQTIDRYTNKIKDLEKANETQKEQLKKEIADIKEELKTEKNNYEKIKKDFFAKTNYEVEKFTKEDLGKVPTQWIRYATRENKLLNAPKITKMKTYRRNLTIKKLIRKFNKIGKDEKDGVRFVMGFEKARPLRYTIIKAGSAVDKIAGNMGLQMNPQQFHTAFNAGRKNIFDILDADTGDEKTQWEKDMISAIKKRINYYGYAYARERANAWVTPFVEAEKTAKEDEKILETPKTIELNSTQKTTAIAA